MTDPNLYPCAWPLCQHARPSPQFMCPEHWARVPDNLRRWFAATRKGNGTHKQARAACVQWAKANPDSALPPFAAGALVVLREPDMFDSREPVAVRSCFLNKDNRWQVFLANDDLVPAADLVPADANTPA